VDFFWTLIYQSFYSYSSPLPPAGGGGQKAVQLKTTLMKLLALALKKGRR
jgi:hypothetical protein